MIDRGAIFGVRGVDLDWRGAISGVKGANLDICIGAQFFLIRCADLGLASIRGCRIEGAPSWVIGAPI